MSYNPPYRLNLHNNTVHYQNGNPVEPEDLLYILDHVYDVEVCANTLIASFDNHLSSDKVQANIDSLKASLDVLRNKPKTEEELIDELLTIADDRFINQTWTQDKQTTYVKLRKQLYELRTE